MRYAHNFQRVLPIMGCVAALASKAGLETVERNGVRNL
jgi:hypothetical protein